MNPAFSMSVDTMTAMPAVVDGGALEGAGGDAAMPTAKDDGRCEEAAWKGALRGVQGDGAARRHADVDGSCSGLANGPQRACAEVLGRGVALGPDTSVPEASAAHVRRLQRDVESNGPEVVQQEVGRWKRDTHCLLYTSPSPRDGLLSRMPSSA